MPMLLNRIKTTGVKVMSEWNFLLYTVLVFIILNALKTTLFNYFILPEKNMRIFAYKLYTVLAVNIILFSVLFRLD